MAVHSVEREAKSVLFKTLSGDMFENGCIPRARSAPSLPLGQLFVNIKTNFKKSEREMAECFEQQLANARCFLWVASILHFLMTMLRVQN